ncbi:CheW-like domain-containing protein [Desulfonema limicola]|uniref:CheW-like domain-containing protein n=1 Tax=Desulfonema limicola TaxID=45656 RepID=A0A975GI31_9BACT|nr:hypothetical protein [Desulfonema limicola]QTA82107.1 CheW-like domain-containing protein [Desulfonema limicola]
MKTEISSPEPGFEEIRIIIFNIMDIWFGIDMDQISGILQPDNNKDRNYDFFWFHEKLLFRKKNIKYKSPMMLLLKAGKFSTGVLIDQPDDINVPIPVNTIYPLPYLIEISAKNSPLWGVAIIDKKIVLLVDADRLAAGKTISLE